MTAPRSSKYRIASLILSGILLFLIGGAFGYAYAQHFQREREAANLEAGEKYLQEWRSSRRNDRHKQIAPILLDQMDAWNRGDLDGFLAGYWNNPDLEFVSGSTTTKGFQPTKERYFKRYKEGGKEMGKLIFSEIEIAELEAVETIVTGKWELVMSKENPRGGFTLTMRKFENGWKIVKDVTTSDELPKQE